MLGIDSKQPLHSKHCLERYPLYCQSTKRGIVLKLGFDISAVGVLLRLKIEKILQLQNQSEILQLTNAIVNIQLLNSILVIRNLQELIKIYVVYAALPQMLRGEPKLSQQRNHFHASTTFTFYCVNTYFSRSGNMIV